MSSRDWGTFLYIIEIQIETLREVYENGDFVTVSPTYDKSDIFHFRLLRWH